MKLAPDGISRPMMVFNGQYPGPTIVADWGDTIQITVKNSLESNGESIHDPIGDLVKVFLLISQLKH
jgi:FtsP/CotA-like multicopper oxidase with cupredoxin domain